MDAELAALRRAGLTDYEARAYAALLSLGESGASGVAESARIPRTKVYAVLDGLVAGGWAEVSEGRPRSYAACSPRDCLDRARLQADEIMERGLTTLEARFQHRDEQFAGQLWILRGAEAMRRRATAMLRSARQEVFLGAAMAVPPPSDLVVEVQDAAKRGVAVRASAADGTAAAEAFDGGGISRAPASLPVQILQVDGAQGLITFYLPRPGGLEIRSVWNPNPSMASLMAEAFRVLR